MATKLLVDEVAYGFAPTFGEPQSASCEQGVRLGSVLEQLVVFVDRLVGNDE